MYLSRLMQFLRRARKTRLDILRDIEGVVESGEVLVVLGRPGSGCSTLLKTLAVQTYGFHVDGRSHINYQGKVYESGRA
jgi:ATP-binding cassette, subfamily G (WHITE), member 2, PDR